MTISAVIQTGTGKKDGLKDFDNDGLSNAEELKNNTDIFFNYSKNII